MSALTGKDNIARVIDASSFSQATTDIDHFMTNVSSSIITPG